jgi:hypothetical protein
MKFCDLLNGADKPLNENIKHSKLEAIECLYNLKCMGRWRNTIFLSLLEGEAPEWRCIVGEPPIVDVDYAKAGQVGVERLQG